jgi:N utilization substance protein B
MELKKNSRKIAVQAVFQFFFSNENANKVLDEFHEYRVKEKAYCRLKYDMNFLNKIVRGVFNDKEEIFSLIEECLSKEWMLDRVDPTMQAILSLAIYEFKNYPDTPTNVVINEYVSIARLYLDDSNTGFVNGVLDKIGKKLKNKKYE